MQITRTTAQGFGFTLSPCAPPCSSTGCSDSLTAHHSQPEFTVQHCATRTHHWLFLFPSQGGQPACGPAAGQQQRVTSGHGQGWAVPSSPGPAGQEPQPSPKAQLTPGPSSVGLVRRVVRMAKAGWSVDPPSSKGQNCGHQVFPQQIRE